MFPVGGSAGWAGQERAKLGSHQVLEIEIRSQGSGLRLRPCARARPDCHARLRRIDRRWQPGPGWMASSVKGRHMLEEVIRVVTSRSTSYDGLTSGLGIFVLRWILFPFTAHPEPSAQSKFARSRYNG